NRSWLNCYIDVIFQFLTDDDTHVRQAAVSAFAKCLEGIYVLLSAIKPTTIRSFFHYQYDKSRLLIHFFKHSLILHDLNNLQLLFDIINLIYS
ncbi:unnamed protein product, partial [Rotaria sp. Silwood1]